MEGRKATATRIARRNTWWTAVRGVWIVGIWQEIEIAFVKPELQQLLPRSRIRHQEIKLEFTVIVRGGQITRKRGRGTSWLDCLVTAEALETDGAASRQKQLPPDADLESL